MGKFGKSFWGIQTDIICSNGGTNLLGGVSRQWHAVLFTMLRPPTLQVELYWPAKAGLESWARKHHAGANGVLNTILRRSPLVVLAGDVGSGKSELAETIGARSRGKRRSTSRCFR
jgi:hypothetical protein